MPKALQMTDLENHLRQAHLKLVLEHTFSIHFGNFSMFLSLREFPTKMSQQTSAGFRTKNFFLRRYLFKESGAMHLGTCWTTFGADSPVLHAFRFARGGHCQQQENSFKNIACLWLRQILGNAGDVGEKCLKGMHGRALERWASGLDHFMKQQLYRERVGWASSLLVITVSMLLGLLKFISSLVEKFLHFYALLSCKYL